MKKTVVFGMVAVLTAGAAIAQDDVVMVNQMGDSDHAETKVTLEAALLSSHVWRGQVQNDGAVFQPQITASQYGVSINVWGNLDFSESFNGTQGDFSEIDLSLAYTLPLDFNDVSFDVGLVNYHFTGNGDPGTTTRSTTELFLRGTILSWVDTFKDYGVSIIPSVTLFGDVDQVEGLYFLFDLAIPYEVSDVLAVEGGLSAGYGNPGYNEAYWGTGTGAGWNDFNVYGNVSYKLMEGLTAAATMQYSLVEGSLDDNASAIYEDDQKFWVGLNIAYDF